MSDYSKSIEDIFRDIYDPATNSLQVNAVNGLFYPQVANYSALPAASGVSGKIYAVLAGEGTYLVNRKSAGLWYSDGASWSRLGNIPAYFSDANVEIYNSAAPTKLWSFSAASITAGQTRILTMADANVDLADIALNNTHRGSDGSDHSFIDQDVTATGTPTFGITTLGDSSQLASDAAPTADADIANKKYVDDNGGGAPGGADTQVQFNNSGSFGGSADLTWDGTSLATNGFIKLNADQNTYLQLGAVDSTGGTNWGFISTSGQENGTGLAFETTNGAGSAIGAIAMYITNAQWVSIGAGVAPLGRLHVAEATLAEIPLFERPGKNTDSFFIGASSLATHTGDMGDGFGSGYGFKIRDDADVINTIAYIGAKRAGADNTGDIVFVPVAAGSAEEQMRITSAGYVGIGTTSPEAMLDIQHAYTDIDGATKTTVPTLRLAATDTGAANIGGTILFEANEDAAGTELEYAGIKGAVASSNDASGYLAFSTRKAGDGLSEKVRITEDGGIAITCTAGQTIAAFEAVAVSTAGSSNRVYTADANDTTRLQCIGVAINGGESGDTIIVVVSGRVTNTAWNFTVGQPCTVSTTAGTIVTTTAHLTAGRYFIQVGAALTADDILVNPQKPEYIDAAGI